MSPHEKTALRIIAAAFAVIMVGQFLSGIFGYLVALVVLCLLAIRFLGRR
ncbi:MULTISPECIES: hypothetical protein [Streptomyces]|uniref:Phosphatidate cytidylyltransferase n=1 Tax=Streptomyces sp. NBC_00060 TaxID=2975636 RepID=A0AAU2H459_9ACTN